MQMNARIKYSVLLIGVGIILAFLPFDASQSFRIKPSQLLEKSVSSDSYISVDQVARFMNNEDSTVLIIDVRSPEEFKRFNIPGAVNIPFSDLLNPVWDGYLNQKGIKHIFYGNGDQTAAFAWTTATGLGYENNFIMKGGLNEWFITVMLSEFSGEKISALENARFENRLNARKIFTQINSLPDSLKTKFFNAKRLSESKLDGGCQ